MTHLHSTLLENTQSSLNRRMRAQFISLINVATLPPVVPKACLEDVVRKVHFLSLGIDALHMG